MVCSLLMEQLKIFDLLVQEFHFVNNYHKVNLIVYSFLLMLSYLLFDCHHFHFCPFLHCHFHHYQKNCQKVFLYCVIFMMSFFHVMYPHGFSTRICVIIFTIKYSIIQLLIFFLPGLDPIFINLNVSIQWIVSFEVV